jgi:NifU-like protein involved in Fe-S cluster formation
MSLDPYNSTVREYFAQPDHAGIVENGAIGYFEDQGMRIRLSVEVAHDRLLRLRFQTWGCPHVIAACEAFCRQFEGRPVADLEQFESAQIMRDLAVPVEKTGRILVLEDTVRSLGQAIKDQTFQNQVLQNQATNSIQD